MEVTIKHAGNYASFPYKGKFAKFMGPRRQLKAGDKVDLPIHYANTIIEMDLAEATDPFRMAEGEAEDIQVSAAARALADEHGLDLSYIEGTGVSGKITIADVKLAMEESRI